MSLALIGASSEPITESRGDCQRPCQPSPAALAMANGDGTRIHMRFDAIEYFLFRFRMSA
jgi:hypothetical protein